MNLDIKESWKHAAAELVEKDDVTFNAWFDATSSREQTVANAAIDFYHRILDPEVYQYIGDPRGKTCLEIGCGAGRLVNVALDVFGYAYGIDIYDQRVMARVSEYLSERHDGKFSIIDGDCLESIPNSSVDFAYSFIVFQHMHSFDEAKKYVDMLGRVIKSNGCCKLFCVLSNSCHSLVDHKSYEHNNRIETLCVSRPDMLSACTEAGLKLVSVKAAGLKKLWDVNGPPSSQHIFTIVKP